MTDKRYPLPQVGRTTFDPQQESEARKEDLEGIVADDLPGIVGESLWASAVAGMDSQMGLL